jgi:hypothetical protein
MRIDVALLCDAVTVREGLLNILAGGITRTTQPEYPAQFKGGLALRIMIHPTEATKPHDIEMFCQGEDGKHLFDVNGQFQSQSAGHLPGEELSLPMALDFNLQLPEPGAYSFEILIDNIHQASVPVQAVKGNP